MTCGSRRTSAGVPSAMLLAVVEHGDAVADAHDEPMSCSMSRTVSPSSSRSLRMRSVSSAVSLRVHAGGRLVEQQQLRARWRARGRSRAGAGRRTAGCGPSRRRGPEADELEQLHRALRSPARSSRSVRGADERSHRPSWSVWRGVHADQHVVEGRHVPNSRMFWNVRATPDRGDLVRLARHDPLALLADRRWPSNRSRPPSACRRR